MKLLTILSDAINSASVFLSEHKQEVGIITCMTAGVCATASGIHATCKAYPVYMELKEKSEDGKVSPKDMMTKVILPNYIPTAAFTAIELGSGTFSIKEYHRQEAAWMATMELSRNEISELRKWKEGAEKKLAVEDKKAIEQEVKQEEHKEVIEKSNEISTNWDAAVWTGHGNQPFIDAVTGQKFYASVPWIEACANRIGRILNECRSASYNEYLNILCEDSYEKMENYISDLAGWNVDNGYPTPEFEGKYQDEYVGSVTIVDWSIRPTAMYEDRYRW